MVNKIKGDFHIKHKWMIKYVVEIWDYLSQLQKYMLEQIPQRKNDEANTLVTLGPTTKANDIAGKPWSNFYF